MCVETDGLEKHVNKVINQGDGLVNDAHTIGSNADHIQDDVDALKNRYDDLRRNLGDKCGDLENASEAVNAFNVSHCKTKYSFLHLKCFTNTSLNLVLFKTYLNSVLYNIDG